MSSDTAALVQEIVTEEIELFTTLVVTDHEPLRLRDAGDLPDARLVVMPNLEHPITVVDKLALHAARAGKKIRTWCSATDSGRRIALEVARTLNPAMGGGRVLHITVPPDRWQPALHSFEELVETARPTAPVSPAGGTAPAAEPQPFDTSPAEVTRRIILRFGGELLVVAPPQSNQASPSGQALYSTGYALGDNGIWHADGDTWVRWLIETAEIMHQDAALALRGRALLACGAAIDRIKRPGMVEQVRPMLRAVLELLRRDGEPCHDVMECAAEDLNAKQRYLGTKSGVVDLKIGTLFSPDKGRKALVTVLAPTEFDPAARHPIVDDLLGRMSPERRGHFMGALGNALRSNPKRLYAVVCEPDCGKTTYHNLIVNTLGPVYAKVAGVNVIQDRRNAMTSDTQLTPGLTAWWSPTRIILMDEVKETSLSPELVKDLTGGGKLTARGLRQDLQTKPVTATTFMLSNEETVPQLRLDDPGLRARYRELRLPYIPDDERDDGYIRGEGTQLPEVRAAFLAALVAAAKENPEPPEDTPEVKANTAKRVEQDAGELGRLARRLVRDGEARLAFPDMWVAWCQANSEPTEVRAPGGIGKRTIVRRLRAYHTDLPDPTTVRIENRNVRGWRGWRLLTAEELENELAVEQALNNLQKAVRGWDKDQIEKAIPLLEKLAEGEIVEHDGSEYIAAPGYSYMESDRKPSTAFHQAYKWALLARAGRQPISNIEADVALMLAEKYLVQADGRLGGVCTADELAAEAARQMTADMGTASKEFTPEAKLVTDELERIILWLSKGHVDAQPAHADAVATSEPPALPPDPLEAGLPHDPETSDLSSG